MGHVYRTPGRSLNAIEEYQRDLRKDPDNELILDEITFEKRILQIIDDARLKEAKINFMGWNLALLI